jgi:hypothetical protein
MTGGNPSERGVNFVSGTIDATAGVALTADLHEKSTQ